jgi:hypothetical protein
VRISHGGQGRSIKTNRIRKLFSARPATLATRRPFDAFLIDDILVLVEQLPSYRFLKKGGACRTGWMAVDQI